MSSAHKDAMRDAVIHQQSWSPEQRKAILDYCLEDVLATERLMLAMDAAGHIPWRQAAWRGGFMFACAYIEHIGIPIDLDTYRRLEAERMAIRQRMIDAAAAQNGFDVYDGPTFKEDKFAAYLSRVGVDVATWPHTRTGKLEVRDEVFSRMVRRYPTLTSLRDLRLELDKLQEMDLSVGEDGRNRFEYWPFASKTGRSLPSPSRNIMGGPRWLRALVQPPADGGYVLAIIDYVAQEFAIGAGRSGDKAMQAAYLAGDVHMATAIAIGLAPRDATDKSHPAARRTAKALNFLSMYGGGPQGLARKIKVPEAEATRFLQRYRAGFPDFTRWADGQEEAAMCRGWMETPMGWHLDASKERNRRTLRNWQLQSSGSDMLHAAVVLLINSSFRVCATMHDAIMVELPLATWQSDLAEVRSIMEEVGKVVANGLHVRTDAKVLLPGQRYIEETDDEFSRWQKLAKILTQPTVSDGGFD
jgi:DNA polymerase-1